MLESTSEQRLRREIKKHGGWAIKLDSESGLPDRLLILPGGKVVFVEMKQINGRTRKVQDVVIARLRAKGHDVRVVHGTEQVMDLVKELFPDE